jgi:hypothetical protein
MCGILFEHAECGTEHQLKLDVRNPAGASIATHTFPIGPAQAAAPSERLTLVNVGINVVQFPLATAGAYDFVLFIGEQELGRRRLYVTLADKPKPEEET